MLTRLGGSLVPGWPSIPGVTTWDTVHGTHGCTVHGTHGCTLQVYMVLRTVLYKCTCYSWLYCTSVHGTHGSTVQVYMVMMTVLYSVHQPVECKVETHLVGKQPRDTLHCTVPVNYSTVQYSTVQYSTVQHSTGLDCTGLYCTNNWY